MGAGGHGDLTESAHVPAVVASRKQSENVTDHSKILLPVSSDVKLSDAEILISMKNREYLMSVRECLLNREALRHNSTCFLEAQPGKFDIKRPESGILSVILPIGSLFKLAIKALLSIFYPFRQSGA